MKTLFAGKFTGADAIMNIGLGGIPDWVRIRNLAADFGLIEWSKHMCALACILEGIKTTDNSGTPMVDELTYGTGVKPYHGGDLIATPAATNIVPLSLCAAAYHGDMRGKTGTLLNTWTLGSAANRTGSWNAECDTTYIGAGSRIMIDGKWYHIIALTSNGEQANEVTLDQPAPSGTIDRIEFKHDLYNAPAGLVMPAGITLAYDTDINVAGERLFIEAGLYE